MSAPFHTIESARRRAEEIARDVLAPQSSEVDRDARWPEAGLRALQRALGGLVVPQSAGGMGLGLLALARVCEALGRECGSTAICFGMHCVGSAVLAAKATPAQATRYLEPIARGEHLTTLALSEPGTGSHFYLPETTVARDEAGVVVTGEKSFVTNGGHADSYVISVRSAAPNAPPGEFSCLVLPAGTPGVSWGPSWEGWGMRGNSARTMRLEGARLSADVLLGEVGDEIWYVFQVVAPYFLIAMSGTYLGIAAAALDEALEHLKTRRHSHSSAALAETSVLQHRVGRLWAQVERTRLLIYQAAQLGDEGAPGSLPLLCAAKAEVAECAVAISNEALTLVGGRGYQQGAKLARSLRDARAAHVMAPTTDMLWTWAGRALLDQPLLAP